MRSNSRYGTVTLAVTAILLGATLNGCGSGGTSPTPTPTPIPTPTPVNPTDQQRGQAAKQTANSTTSCVSIQPFYWEIGDRNAMLTGGTAGGATPVAGTQMLIASASKWLFGAYVVQLRNGSLTANDLSALTMRSGRTKFVYGSCIKLVRANQDAETVAQCFNAANSSGTNADLDANAVGKFFYNGGHFQWLSDGDLQLGAANNASLKAAIAAQIGLDFTFAYDSPQLAGGAVSSGADYGFFLRKILSNQLRMHDALGTNPVCTNPVVCPSAALSTPIPLTESWHYSAGHWVEDDPAVGDGSFSSPGAFGFYPWIDASKTYYGVLARQTSVSNNLGDTVALESVACGRKIRKAWVTVIAQ